MPGGGRLQPPPYLRDDTAYGQLRPVRRESNWVTQLGCSLADCLSDRPQLAVAKSTAHEYLSFPLLLCPADEGSWFCPIGWDRDG